MTLSIPSVISLLISSVYQLTDAYFISELGIGQTAAVSINSSLEQLITMMGTFLCTGASSFIARSLGAGDVTKASRTLSFAFFSGVGFGAALMAGGLAFLMPLVRFLGATPDIEGHCVDYARYVLLAAPFMIGSFVTNKCLYSEGKMVYAMIGMVSGAAVNVALDPLLIFRLDLGIAGASIATAISKAVSFAILLLPYLRGRTVLSIRTRYARPDREIVGEVVRIGSPSLLRVALMNTAAIILNNLAGNYPTAVLAGVAASNRVMSMVSTVIFGLGQGYQPVVGQNWGAGKYERVMECYRFTVRLGVGSMSVLGAALFIFARPVVMLFANSGPDPTMIRCGLLLIRSQCLVLPVQAWVTIVNMGYNSSGKAIGAAVLSLSRQGICYIPMLLILPRLFGADGLVTAQAAADLLSLAIAVPLGRKWVKALNIEIEKSRPRTAAALRGGVK